MTADLHRDVDDYLELRRALGFKLERHDRFLHDFIDYLTRHGSDTITTPLAVAWATQPVDTDPCWWAARLGVVRMFAKHHHAIDARTEVPSADVLPQRSLRAEPFIYTNTDIVGLLAAARRIKTPLKAATYATLIGLLTVTGMRVGEAIRLDRGDLDSATATLTIRGAKFNKTRRVPLHPTTTTALQRYARTRGCHLGTAPNSPALFTSTTGTRLHYSNVQLCFQKLARDAGVVARSARCRPRIHDLRHRFAVQTLTGWYRDGLDIDARLHVLSTYLGHTSPSSTYWYLTGTPELLDLAAQRLDQASQVLP